ncbi:MAG: hypothetical protein KGL43_27165 [Burkholderiales bacterium]|nr:hypothetical protein [Burkholderiales bacterium]
MRSLLRLAVLCVATALPALARADFYVVVQAANPQHSMTQKEVVGLFMGRDRAFTDGEFAEVFDLDRSDPVRASFYRALTGLSQAQVNSYWARLLFSGRNSPPQPVADEAAMAAAIKRNPNAIGWLSHEPTDRSLRTVLVLKEPH